MAQFLLKVLDLPWSRTDEWRSLLLPVYEAIGVQESQVVRCLLASMPPGMTIPVHHDTGYWVRHTHRCHLPIFTDANDVDFLVGPDETSMTKIAFDAGTVVELNNQAKHMVANRMTDKWRVHLIFDYVEDHPIHRIALRPGDRVLQTRRSIDLPSDSKDLSEALPKFIIIGAQKSGTTSLYEYLCQHPLVVKGKRRETHYFDWRWNPAIDAKHDALAIHQKHYSSFFHTDALQKYASITTTESTPSYLLHR